MGRPRRSDTPAGLREELLARERAHARSMAARMYSEADIERLGGLDAAVQHILDSDPYRIEAAVEAREPLVVPAWKVAKDVPGISPRDGEVAILLDGRIVPAAHLQTTP